jgi:hypothetical protein
MLLMAPTNKECKLEKSTSLNVWLFIYKVRFIDVRLLGLVSNKSLQIILICIDLLLGCLIN